MTSKSPVEEPATSAPLSSGPLAGLRILELGHFVAAPFAARLLADLGAEVIKVEPPGGDPVRQWGEQVNGASLWWSMHGRNKLSISLDLKKPRARDIVLGLAAQCDAVIENFRPGQLERWGLGAEALRRVRPDLVIAQISGYGQNGPHRDRPAFGVIGEAVGGLRYLTNRSDPTGEPPVRVGISIGDSAAGLYAALGVVAALWKRDRDGRGRTIDVALSEAVLSLMEGMLPEYGALGKIKQPTGSAIATAAPSNAYPTADGAWILIAANSDPLFRRLAQLIGRPELADMQKYVGNAQRVRNAEELDGIIADWSRQRPSREIFDELDGASIPASFIYTAADCAADPQFRARGMVREVVDPLHGQVLHAGIVPHVPEDPGSIRWAGPALGEHTEPILRDVLGLGAAEMNDLRREGVI